MSSSKLLRLLLFMWWNKNTHNQVQFDMYMKVLRWAKIPQLPNRMIVVMNGGSVVGVDN